MAEILLSAVIVVLLILCAPGIKRAGVRGLVLTAMLSALASAGRAAMASIPNVQPATFVIIVCGICLGGQAGFVCGVVTALLSSLLTSVGPWTIWQAFCWGLIGLLSSRLSGNRPFTMGLYGLFTGFLFGWVMNLWYYSAGILPLTLQTWFAACVASFTFDLAHALTNFGLLLGFGKSTVRYLKKAAAGQNGGT
jgi:energy-coupling factor transport system substrate-specific component